MPYLCELEWIMETGEVSMFAVLMSSDNSRKQYDRTMGHVKAEKLCTDNNNSTSCVFSGKPVLVKFSHLCFVFICLQRLLYIYHYT